MMGNETSANQLAGLEVDTKAIEVTDGWTLHAATITSGNIPAVSIFISGLLSGGDTLSLEKAAKNLMLHRHPRILKYVSTWKKNGKFYLATEAVTPLSHVLHKLTPLQTCIGLHSILKALIFLHEKALSSHNNVCCAAIYVTPDGTWKLGGLEYLCQFSKISHKLLEQTNSRRYERAIPPEVGAGKLVSSAIDTFGFGVLAEEALRGHNDDSIPAMGEFLEMCRTRLKNQDPHQRPTLAHVAAHPFVCHPFITLHAFLLELPLKPEMDKQAFFRTVWEDLSGFPEELVASQLGGLLLSRLVLLDLTAQECLLPRVLTPKTDEGGVGLFSLGTYRVHLVPRLLQMMSVRDAQIRLLLLAHFPAICSAFSADQLRAHVLPELLVGIKDTNDHLVSVTLHVLADLVPMLGAATVIGGKRGKLFTDGRPKARGVSMRKSPLRTPSAVTSAPHTLPERPSPDGGEDQSPTSDEETEPWSDWDVAAALSDVDIGPVCPEGDVGPAEGFVGAEPIQTVGAELIQTVGAELIATVGAETIPTVVVGVLPDISTLDIKHSTSTSRNREEIDFFEDMVPVISKTHFTHIEEDLPVPEKTYRNKGKFDVTNEEEAEGWGDELEDWGDVGESVP